MRKKRIYIGFTKDFEPQVVAANNKKELKDYGLYSIRYLGRSLIDVDYSENRKVIDLTYFSP